jgi:hypothetical protein
MSRFTRILHPLWRGRLAHATNNKCNISPIALAITRGPISTTAEINFANRTFPDIFGRRLLPRGGHRFPAADAHLPKICALKPHAPSTYSSALRAGRIASATFFAQPRLAERWPGKFSWPRRFCPGGALRLKFGSARRRRVSKSKRLLHQCGYDLRATRPLPGIWGANVTTASRYSPSSI